MTLTYQIYIYFSQQFQLFSAHTIKLFSLKVFIFPPFLYTAAQGGRTNSPELGTSLELTQSRWYLEQLLDLALHRCGMTVPAIFDKCLNSVSPHNQPNSIGKEQSFSPFWTCLNHAIDVNVKQYVAQGNDTYKYIMLFKIDQTSTSRITNQPTNYVEQSPS